MIRSELCSKVEIHFQKKAPKVEKVLKGSLDLIPSPSPSMKIQIMGGKISLGCKGKKLLGVDNSQKCFAFISQANFPTHYLNFHRR